MFMVEDVPWSYDDSVPHFKLTALFSGVLGKVNDMNILLAVMISLRNWTIHAGVEYRELYPHPFEEIFLKQIVISMCICHSHTDIS